MVINQCLYFLNHFSCFVQITTALPAMKDVRVSPITEHDRRVALVCKTMASFQQQRAQNTGLRVPFDAPHMIANFDHMIEVDLSLLVARVEPNMTMHALAEATLSFGYLPRVVARAKKMTVADAFAATTNDSSSFLHGTFHCNVQEIEVVLGDGELVYATREDAKTAELFHGSAGAMNSLGLITLFTIAIIRAGPCVRLTSHPVGSNSVDALSTAMDLLQNAPKHDSVDYVEGYLADGKSGVVLYATSWPAAEIELDQTGDSFFERAIRVSKSQDRVYFMSIIDYLFRDDDSGNDEVFQNFGLCYEGVPGFIDKIQEQIGKVVFPIWIYPVDLRSCRRTTGVASNFAYSIGFQSSRNTKFDAVETYLMDKRAGFRYLHCRVKDSLVSRDERYWEPGIHLRWCYPPWRFHDDHWYFDLRSKWKSEPFTDLRFRVNSIDPPPRYRLQRGRVVTLSCLCQSTSAAL
jgi:hypothetical protein